MPDLRKTLIALKGFVLTKVIPHGIPEKPPFYTPTQIIDNERVMWAVSKPTTGKRCIDCTYYNINFVQDQHLMKDGDDNPIHVTTPDVKGMCLYLMPQFIITNVYLTQGCILHQKRQDEFFDDAIEDKLKVW